MFLEKIKELIKTDPLLPHKIGIVAGAAIGVVLGFIVSDKADQYEVRIIEEVTDGETDV